MDYRPLDITVISAEGLKDVNRFTRMDPYVLVSITDNPNTRLKTLVHKNGGQNPRWNHRLQFSINTAAAAGNPNLSLLFKLRSQSSNGDKDIGEVTVPLKQLLGGGGDGDGERVVVYQVCTSSGKPQGTLKFSYKLGGDLPPPSPLSLHEYARQQGGLQYQDQQLYTTFYQM